MGDFNDWNIDNNYLMKRDGDNWWITLSNLERGKEYAFQYLVDESIRIADPYTNKILDPWNDQYIPESVYPNLKPYPVGKTEGIVSIVQTAQNAYQWEVPSFTPVAKDKMVIYELHIRDFTTDRSFDSTLEKLDYLQNLGINTIELLPINEFEGNNSWGYNPSFYFAVDKYYGTSDAFKKFVDECHKRGIGVIIDMVLNHSYGQSPFAQLYFDSHNNQISADNPWYNIESPNTAYSWGYDFNHESIHTQQLVDSINSFWMDEYKVDGFRFDFTKGFTNTPGDGWAYDKARIDILTRMSNEIYKRNPEAVVILEHLAENWEEIELSNNDMMLWGNMNHNYGEAVMGYNDSGKSNLDWGIYTKRGWSKSNLVAYMESHDEERLVYKAQQYGRTQDLGEILKHAELAAAFYFTQPGAKMIWQFGELGYDYGINTCSDGETIKDDCRVAEKPIRWDYYNDPVRKKLYDAYSKLIDAKVKYSIFESTNITSNLNDAQKYMAWEEGNRSAFIVGNFDMTAANINISLPSAGEWLNLMTGETINITDTNYSVSLEPGEYRLFIQKDETTWNPTTQSTEWFDPNNWTNGVPTAESKVTIPSGLSTYPKLNSVASVDIINIEVGAELKGQDMLTYNKAFVNYDFGTGNRSTHFRMHSVPLMEVYHADFTFGGKPNSYLQTLQVIDGRGKWVTIKGGNNTPFQAGSAFTISLDPDQSLTEGLGLSGGILKLPFFDSSISEVDAKVHPNHTFSFDAMGTMTSKFTNPNNDSQFYTINRSANAYKLAGADVSVNTNFMLNSNQNIALVGNPFVTSIDFDKLYEVNSSLIKNNYQVWTKVGDAEGYISYTPEGHFGLRSDASLNNVIAPLQGFIVEQNENNIGNLNFNLSTVTADNLGKLRSAKNVNDKITIIAKNRTASVSTFIAKRAHGSTKFGSADARKLMNELNEAPEVYTLKPADNKMILVGANITNDNDAEYPVGIATSQSGEITLTFSGMDSYNESKIFFTDKVLDKTIDLTGMNSYDYTFDYVAPIQNNEVVPTNDRFCLRTVSATSSINEDFNTNNSFVVYADKGFVLASVANGSSIKEIEVYNLSGAMIYQRTNINQASYTTSSSFASGAYIVKIKTDNNTESKKVIIK